MVTKILIIRVIWGFVSFGYSMFNGFLTKILEKPGETEGDLYFKYLLINSFGIPGSILGILTKLMYRLLSC
jgi:hypothetical protein